MSNEKLKQAIFEALTPEYESAVPQIDDHIFSSAFEKKMAKLIRWRNKPYFMMVNTVGKRVACFIIGIFIASSLAIMNVEALRNAFIDFFMNIFDKFSIVQSIDTDESPQTIDDIYEITYDLSDYTIDYEEYDNYSRNITYMNGNDVIDYYQYVKSVYDIHINTEDSTVITMMINDHEAIYFCDNHNYHNLIWDNGYYIISLRTTIGKDELIDIANSVQKAE